jgi:hypothetical protein
MPEIIIVPIFFVCLTYMVVTIARTIQRSHRDKHMAEVMSKMVDRMGTGPDLANFVNSDAYRALMASESARDHGGNSRILNSLQAGSVLFAAGAAMLATGSWAPNPNVRVSLGVDGAVLAAVGLALALSAVWSNMLMKRWNAPEERNSLQR